MSHGPSPPPEIVSALARYDAGLRLRWGRFRQMWMIEKRLPERHPSLTGERPNPYGKGAAAKDLFEGARAGYVHVLSVHPTLLRADVVLGWLRANDLHVQGTWAAINRRLDALAEAEEAAVDRQIDTLSEDGAKALHDRLAWSSGRRVSLDLTPPAPPTEVHDGFVVRDRRVTVTQDDGA